MDWAGTKSKFALILLHYCRPVKRSIKHERNGLNLESSVLSLEKSVPRIVKTVPRIVFSGLRIVFSNALTAERHLPLRFCDKRNVVMRLSLLW